MKIVSAFRCAYWYATGKAAFRSGDYDRALACFDRAAAIFRCSPEIAGYRAMTLLLKGEKLRARAAFFELAEAEDIRTSRDEYAKLYGQMFVAYLHSDLAKADRLAEEMQQLQVSGSIKRILFPMERPSSIAIGLDGPSKAVDLDQIKRHFSGLYAYHGQAVRIRNDQLTPGGSP